MLHLFCMKMNRQSLNGRGCRFFVFSTRLRWGEEYFQSRLQAPSRGHGSVSVARKSLLRSVGLHKSLRLEIFFSGVTEHIPRKLVEETGEISEDLRDADRDVMQKAKHAFKRPPLKHILNGPLWTRFRFLHGVGQSIPQRVALEAGAFSPVSAPPRQPD